MMRNNYHKWTTYKEDVGINYEMELYWDSIITRYTTFYDNVPLRYSFEEFQTISIQEKLVSIHGKEVIAKVQHLITKIKNPKWEVATQFGQFKLAINAERYVVGSLVYKEQTQKIEMKSSVFVAAEELLHQLKKIASDQAYQEIIQLAHISFYYHNYDQKN